jgi:hypothetical protein
MKIRNPLQFYCDWLTCAAKRELTGCKIAASDGSTLYTPDGQGNYRALWTRDFSYMVSNAFELLPVEDVRSCINYLMQGQRCDGCIPDRVQADGVAVYSAGPVHSPLGDPPTDNSQFMVNLVYEYVKRTKDREFAVTMLPGLHKAMDFMPRNELGLIFIPENIKKSPYGFTDTIAKTGELLFSSLLYWQACKEMASLCVVCNESADSYLNRAEQIVSNLDILWNAEAGAYLAAAGKCAQIDIWGNAYAIYCGFLNEHHIPNGRKSSVLDFLVKNVEDYILRGQVRHLLEGHYWEQTLIPVAPGTYQNGAYWATASGWVIYLLYQVDKCMAVTLLQELVNDFKLFGIFECVNVDYEKLNHYVVSVVNPLGAINLLLRK